MLLAVRFLISAPWPIGGDDRYYWEHCGWVDRSQFASDSAMANAVVSGMRSYYTTQIRFHAERYYLPNTSTVYFERSFSPTEGGHYAAAEGPTLLIAARWRMRADDGSTSYHLHRAPIGDDDLLDAEWSGDGLFRQQTHMNDFIDEGIWRTKTGAFITTGEVAESPVAWQLRHGTKRRRSRFWLP